VSARAPETVPHEFPFRLVERVEDGPHGRSAVVLATACGALTGAGPWPVTLVAEALAQAILLVLQPQRRGTLRLVALDRVVLYQPIEPGDRLEVEVEEVGSFGELRRFACRGLRGGGLAAAAEVTVAGS
jgi:3-hydroxymyristoyl/3-hydroxydecanoyl-(acyl carrier protein) dehydratase